VVVVTLRDSSEFSIFMVRASSEDVAFEVEAEKSSRDKMTDDNILDLLFVKSTDCEDSRLLTHPKRTLPVVTGNS